ncbi:M20/M25/M40 family metallo-hydrolase [Mumia sp. ZJ1417]|uniref:M20/M25/M40 family metallo-hydrolase n=1 Tax=Mumia sp. ZJ1417 TaxID=2708082 RepID=UPI00142025DC|nr:M20/M25/M40 family metallo-hydrolase [Mumia sp. ZJ1417]QMW65817.1 M20/M25/M40 family metallo-hydrolase [Mumia sp. ZJ1417]
MTTICAGFAIATLVAAGAAPASAGSRDHDDRSTKKITHAVKLKAVLDHLEELQEVSDEHGDRAAGRPGYAASVQYVVTQLRRAGYDPQVQEFPFDYVEENSELIRVSPEARTFEQGTDFLRNAFDTGSPEGTVTGPLTPIDLVVPAAGLPPNSNTSGCEAADFADLEPGGIALMQRGTCGFAVKALNAQAAGAGGVVIMNEGQTDRTGLINMIGDATGLAIPTVFATSATGEDLARVAGSTVTVTVDYVAETRSAYNVVAETRKGDDSNVVMAGAHLDGVQDGAGINDNGTGSAALLETAIQMRHAKPNNTVRFAWWGAEESGLLGSEHYVAALSPDELDDIALYLNFDMVGSPNYMFGVYDGDNSSGTADPETIPPGSDAIEDVFEKFYADRGEPFQDTEFSGRSDYGPFIAVGVPAGGLFTGAEGEKTAEEAALYGGVAGAAYDPCYHAFCDNLRGDGQDVALYDQLREHYRLVGNVNKHALDVNSDAIAAATWTFAYDTSTVNGVEPPRRPHRGHGHGKGLGHGGPLHRASR